MIGRLPLSLPRIPLWPGLLLLAGLAAIFGTRPPARVLAAVNFIDSGQELGGDVESSAVALGDVDGDGDPDAIVANYGGPSKLWINQGGDQGGAAGHFQDSGQTLSSNFAVDVALGDLDGDTDLDAFIVLDSFGDSNQVWINQGLASGTFSQTAQVFGDQLSTSVNLAPLDDNGTLDAYVGRAFGQPSKVWFNNGAGQFADSGQSLDSNSNDVALADFDGDGDLDAYSANGAANKVWINQGGDQGGAAGVYSDSLQTLGTALSLAAAAGDLDGNSGPDIYDANSITDRVWLNDGAAAFSPGSAGSTGQSRDVALADFDGDGDLDAFVAKGAANEVWINQGGQQGGDPGDLDDSGLSLGSSFSDGLAVADLDGDGDLDVFVANWGAPNRVWLNQRLAPNPSGFGWQVESVTTRGNSGLRGAIALDGQGYPHIAFVEHLPVVSGMDDQLRYAYWDGVRWHTELVDKAPHISRDDGYIGLALDSAGVAHIAYPAGDTAIDMNLRYARRNHDYWALETVDDLKRTGRHVSIALDGNDRPHIAYHDNDFLELIYTSWNGATWTSEVIDDSNVNDSGVFASLVLDGDDRPHIAYADGVSDQLRYATKDTGVWQTSLVDPDIESSTPYPDIVLSPAGQPAIAYIGEQSFDYEVRYAAWDGAAWGVEVARPIPAGSLDDRISLDFDPQGDPHIIYGYRVGGDLFLHTVYWDGGTWVDERLDNSGQAGSHADMELDAAGNLHAAYYDEAFGDLRHVFWGPNWNARIASAGTFYSPGVGIKENQPGVAYYDLGAGQVGLAQWADGWGKSPADFVSDPVAQVSQAVGSANRHISYYDADNQRLMVGQLSSAGWELRIVDESADVGRHNDLMLVGRNDGRPRIAYWDAKLQRVKVAVIEGAAAPVIHTNTVGPVLNAASGYPHIAQLPGANLGVSYYDGANGDLRFAQLDPLSGAWSDGAVDGLLGSDVGRLNDLQVDGTEGEPVIAYYDESNGAIKFTYRDGGAWHLETAVPVSDTVTSLALELGLDSRTRARVAYVTDAGDLMLASLEGGTWETAPVASGLATDPNAVSLDLDARPHVAYVHTADGLVYAFRSATLDLDASLAKDLPAPTGGYYNPLDACKAVLSFLLDDGLAARAIDLVQPRLLGLPALGPPATGDDLALFESLAAVFGGSAGGQHYIDLYAQHGSEMGMLGLADPALLWDAFGTLQNFLPGLEALVAGRGDEVLVTQGMVDDALDIWTRLAAAASPDLANAINAELAKYNNLDDFVGLSFDQWARAIGVEPPEFVFLPVIER